MSSAPVPAPGAGLAAHCVPSAESSGCRGKAGSIQPRGCSPTCSGGLGSSMAQGHVVQQLGVLPAASTARFRPARAPYGKEP